MANQTRAKPKTETKTAEEKLNEQIAVFEPVAKSVKRKLTHPELNETREFVQHEMGFLTKLKFFKLLSNTIRVSAESNTGTGVADLLQELFDAGAGQSANPEIFLEGLLRLVEMSPEFITQTYVYALSVKPQDEIFVIDSLDSLSDEEGLDILDVFVAQNGDSIYDFFTKKLPKVMKRVQNVAQLDQDQEQSEATA